MGRAPQKEWRYWVLVFLVLLALGFGGLALTKLVVLKVPVSAFTPQISQVSVSESGIPLEAIAQSPVHADMAQQQHSC